MASTLKWGKIRPMTWTFLRKGEMERGRGGGPTSVPFEGESRGKGCEALFFQANGIKNGFLPEFVLFLLLFSYSVIEPNALVLFSAIVSNPVKIRKLGENVLKHLILLIMPT